MPILRPVSIKDIARAAGVSYSTVSRALNDSPLISREVRERIHALAREMGYTPNALAQGLQSRQTNTIGLVITTFSDPFFADVVQGVEEAARRAGFSVLLAASNNDPDQEIQIIENLSRRRVDGIIVAASRIGSEYTSRLETIRIPVIMVNNQAVGQYQNLYSIAVDDYSGACLAVRHLLDLGHRRIGYIGVKNRPGSNERRLRGYLHTLEAAGVQPDPTWIQVRDEPAPGGLVSDARIGREVGAILSRSGVSAVFAYCDSIAAGFVLACRDLGVDVPRQLSVVGFDDSDLCHFVCPPLTTVHQPKREMGQAAVEMFLASLAGGMVNDARVQPTLVVRGSTAPPASDPAG